MKTFKDLKLESHLLGAGQHTKMFFDNGYGISVVSGKTFYTDEKHPYEVAVLIGNEKEYDLTYNTSVTNDVIGYLTADGVTKIMKKIQAL